jgi:hypothetical protein
MRYNHMNTTYVSPIIEEGSVGEVEVEISNDALRSNDDDDDDNDKNIYCDRIRTYGLHNTKNADQPKKQK